MSISIIPLPGKKLGPCADPECGHKDCQELRAIADKKCEYCAEPIGYDQEYFRGNSGWIAHTKCLEVD